MVGGCVCIFCCGKIEVEVFLDSLSNIVRIVNKEVRKRKKRERRGEG